MFGCNISRIRINHVEIQGGPVDEEDLVKKKGKKPNGSKREECEEAVELYLEVLDTIEVILELLSF